MEENRFMASRDRDSSAAGLLRRSLAHPAGPQGAGTDCPAPDILAAYYERSLDAAEAARCDLHFSQCARCREQLIALARADEFAAREETSERKAGWVWLFDWRWLAPAAAVLAIVIVWAARHPAPTRTAEQRTTPPLVAMSQPQEPPAVARPRESLPEAEVAVARPSRAAESSERKTPNSYLGTTRSTQLRQLPAPAAGKEPAKNLPLAANNEQLGTFAKAERAPPKQAAAREVMAGAAEPNATAIAPRAAASSAPPPPPPAPPPHAADQMIAAEPVAAPKAARSETVQTTQAAVSATTGRLTASGANTSLETVEERSAEKLLRTPDPNVLWRITRGGFLERSIDAGATWQGQAPDSNARLIAGSAPAAQICWLVGRNGIILLTTDGKKWRTISPPARVDFVDVAAQSASSATLVAADGRKFSTTDGGKHWKALP
jgi:hypothetical protein